MQIISSYGVELRKQNIPFARHWDLSFCCQLSDSGICRCGKNLQRLPDAKRRFNAAEHLVHTTKRTVHALILISGFPRCLPI